MNECYITFRSITRAQNASSLLRMAGISHQMLRTPKFLAVQGCGYALRIRPESVHTAAEILQRNAIGYQRIYTGDSERFPEEILP